MKVRIDGVTKDYRTLWMEGQIIKLIDQRKLPHRFEIITLENHHDTAKAIKDMVMRGAGAIGVAGGYGMAQSALEAREMRPLEFEKYIQKATLTLKDTRPTAANLYHAIDRCLNAASTGSVKERVSSVIKEAAMIASEDLYASEQIGIIGSELIEDDSSVLTHCNAGALAFIDYGTALSPIKFAHIQGKKVFVFVDETRPRCQGARLTTWELEQEGIPYALIVDNAAGYFMRRGEVDLIIVGADRIASNGDVANKIGTYEKAVVAHENRIPFYVAAPRMTFDLDCPSGDHIEIEERDGVEVTSMWGLDDKEHLTKILIAKEKTPVRNPGFDVTPSKYITGFITEGGLLKKPYMNAIASFSSEMSESGEKHF